jgi:hypothetical protein
VVGKAEVWEQSQEGQTGGSLKGRVIQ